MVSRRVQALLDQLRAQGIQDEQVLNALAAVPREKFVDEAFEQKAWDNIALPIGQGQTISQPYMVARMTELLELTPQSRVLEIGTGSGYQTAILAHLVQHVCSVERIKGLQWQARRRLKNLDLHNVSTRHGDGWQGWQARAPFDAIIVTAAPPEYRPRCWRSWMMTACWCCRSAKSISFSNGSVVGATNLSLIPSRPFALFPW